VAHAYAPVRERHTDRLLVRSTVDVDVPTHRVYRAEPVPARLQPGEPENPAEDPVASRQGFVEFRRTDLAGRTPPPQHRTGRQSLADPRPDDVTAPRRAQAVGGFAGAETRGRHREGSDGS